MSKIAANVKYGGNALRKAIDYFSHLAVQPDWYHEMTKDKDFMESVWWVIGELWKKGLIYQGTKVVPFSTALGTVL